MNTITIYTDGTNRIIKQTLQALTKAKAISSAYKIPYIKHYTKNEKGTLTTKNIQLIVMFTTDSRDKSNKNILDNILKSWSVSDINIL